MLTIPIPEGFAERMHTLPGLDGDALLKALDTDASIALRLNRRKSMTDWNVMYSDMTPVTWCGDGYYLQDRPLFTLNPYLHAGGFYVQDASSMIHQQVVEKLAERLAAERLTVLDFCAAPGGKTTAIINALPDGSVVVANEYIPARGKILRENLEKWGYPSVISTGASASDYAALSEIFDIVAVDAPCSGEGMMRKEDEARRQWTPRLVEECAALQRDILKDVVNTLRPGGYLIYSTCTFNLEEDELNSRFIREEIGLEQVDISELRMHGIEDAGKSLLPDVNALRFMPHLTRGEGLYITIFRKPGNFSPYLENETPAGNNITVRKSRQKGKPGKDKCTPRAMTQLSADNHNCLSVWFDTAWDMRFEQNANLITALPAAATPLLGRLRDAGVRITGAGLPVAEIKGKDLIPDSRLALSTALAKDAFHNVEISEDEALKYLRREAITLPPDTPKGYITVSYGGLRLGLMKNLGNRANNLFPAPWRIRI